MVTKMVDFREKVFSILLLFGLQGQDQTTGFISLLAAQYVMNQLLGNYQTLTVAATREFMIHGIYANPFEFCIRGSIVSIRVNIFIVGRKPQANKQTITREHLCFSNISYSTLLCGYNKHELQVDSVGS